MSPRTAFMTHQRLLQHDMSGHVEHAGRLRAVYDAIDAGGLRDKMVVHTPKPLDEQTILAVHTASHLDRLGNIEAMSNSPLMMIDADTYMTPQSYTLARIAAGAGTLAVDALMDGDADNALVAVRPPGHHATTSRAMGFCLLNNIAIAARYAQRAHGVGRVMIVDYDVHHGNGTQDIFYSDDSVLFISTHQSPLYPGSGGVQETGVGAGDGYTINVPVSRGAGDIGFERIYREIVWPAAQRFEPELILVSAGFDAHWNDPLGGLRLTLNGFSHLNRELIKMANELAQGRIIFFMEGGYDLPTIGAGIANIARDLLGDKAIAIPVSPPAKLPETEIGHVIDRVKQVHEL